MPEMQPEPATTQLESKETEAGSVFVSNYPPYSFWNPDSLGDADRSLHQPPVPDATLGLYLHIPFCRKRCKFCYYRVYTDKNSDEIATYLRALQKEVSLYAALPSVINRPLIFVYFGGGTPSFISAKHLRSLAKELKDVLPWDGAREISFECEPGTLTEAKLEAIREIGVTRLSLGIEHFDDVILEENGRAHHSKEIYRSNPWIKAMNFDQVNFDLIAGMVGETWDTWGDCIAKTIDMDPDSVTIYQMELPYNTVFTHELAHGSLRVPLADWDLKRAWHDYAFERLEQAGYCLSSAYTMVKRDRPCDFVYRDSVWHGTDMIGAGVSSFSHMSGVHFQNASTWGEYLGMLGTGKLPLQRAFSTTLRERLTREMILQMKLGEIQVDYFQKKFGINILEEFRSVFEKLQIKGFLNIRAASIQLTKKGLLQVDSLLPEFYDPKYQGARYM